MKELVVVILLGCSLVGLKPALHILSVEEGIRPEFAACIVENESHWNTELVGDAGDTGLFQIIPSTASWVAEQMGIVTYNLKDPVTNMRMGLWILKRYPEWYSTLYLCEEYR